MPRPATTPTRVGLALLLGLAVGACTDSVLDTPVLPDESTPEDAGTSDDLDAGGGTVDDASADATDAGDAWSHPDVTGGDTGGDVGIDGGEVVDPPDPLVPAGAVVPRLTAEQYRNTIADLYGPALPRLPLEPDTNPYLFYTIGAATSSVSQTGVERYAESAFAVAEAVFDDPARIERIFSCVPAAADDDCAETFVREQGLRTLRRPLTDEEVDRWLSVSRDTADGDPMRGLETVLAGLLQTPHFLYRVELGEPDPAVPGRMRYSSYEMAQRLSYLVWNTTPDDALLEAAARDELTDPVQIEAHTRRMLDDPRARRAVQDFFSQYLYLKQLARAERDPERYPGASPELIAAMETEVRLLVDDLVFRRNADIRRLFSDRRGYVNADLAALYGVDAPGASEVSFVPVDFGPDIPRAGVLTLGAFLTMNAHPTETSPTLRGKYVRERVLCQSVPPPPDDIDLNLEPTEGDPPTLRERLEQHRSDPACAGCHAYIDPPGYLFENYDSIGRFRTEVDGYPVDATGDLDGVPLNDARDLAVVLRDSEQVGRCMAQQLYRHATGRLDEPGERPSLEAIQEEFAASGYRFADLIVAIATSEGFRTVSEPTDDEGTP